MTPSIFGQMIRPTTGLTTRAAICLFAIPLLAACQDDPKPTIVGEDSRGATGEVLGGSISDDMLPLDSLQSTSPAAEEATVDSGGGSVSSSRTASAPEPAPAEPAAQEVAESESTPQQPATEATTEPETE